MNPSRNRLLAWVLVAVVQCVGYSNSIINGTDNNGCVVLSEKPGEMVVFWNAGLKCVNYSPSDKVHFVRTQATYDIDFFSAEHFSETEGVENQRRCSYLLKSVPIHAP